MLKWFAGDWQYKRTGLRSNKILWFSEVQRREVTHYLWIAPAVDYFTSWKGHWGLWRRLYYTKTRVRMRKHSLHVQTTGIEFIQPKKKMLRVNAIWHTQVIIVMLKFHNPISGEVGKDSLSLTKRPQKLLSMQTYAILGLFKRAAGVREAYREHHISFR